MPIRTTITGNSGVGTSTREVSVHTLETSGGRHSGMVVLTDPLVKGQPLTSFFSNDELGTAMNQSIAFGGTPDKIYDGGDTSGYTASVLSGTKYTLDSGNHAKQSAASVLTFGNLTGEIITLTVDGTTTVYTEGVEWSNATGNDETATSIASAIDGNAKILSATASGAVVTVVASTGLDITTFSTNSAGGDMTCTAQSLKSDNSAVSDTVQFAKGSDINLNNYTAITLSMYVDKDWKVGDSIEIYGYDSGLGVEVGNRVQLETYFSFGTFDTWHNVVIPLTDMSLELSTTVDTFRIQNVAKSGKSPKVYYDVIQVEQTGTPAIFSLDVTYGRTFYISELNLTLAGPLAATLANGTMPALSYNKILNISELANGITLRLRKDNRVAGGALGVSIRNIGEMISLGAELTASWGDGTNTFLNFKYRFDSPLVLRGTAEDSFSIQINDDLSSLLKFTGSARGMIELPDDQHT